MRQLKDIDIELAKFLLEQVEKPDHKWTYGDVAAELTKRLNTKIYAHRNLIAPLGNVTELCFDLGLPLITAIVRRKDTKEGVGDGFYKLACELKSEYKSMDSYDAWKQELTLVQRCKDWSPLRNYLNQL